MPVHRRAVVAAAAAVLALGLAATGAVQTTPAAQAASSPRHYVALGDSYTAGPGIPEQRTDPIGCGRSTRNYPALVAEALGVTDYTDVSCSSATTDNMTAPQPVLLGSNPPQFDALRPDTDLVTVSISGNDIGFSDIIGTCFRLSATDPFGNPCERQATAGGIDRYAQRIAATAPKVAGVLAGIRQRSPHAQLLLVGYPRIVPPAGGCYPVAPISRGDVPYLDRLQRQLTAVLAEQASTYGAAFVDSYAASPGHDVCQPPGVKWVEGAVPTSPAAPVHPNATGMHAVAALTLDVALDRRGERR